MRIVVFLSLFGEYALGPYMSKNLIHNFFAI